MEQAFGIIGTAGGSLAIFGIVSAAWWNVDRLISKSAGERIGKALTASRDASGWDDITESTVDVMRQTVAPSLPVLRFVGFVLLSTVIGLIVFLIIYMMLVPEFAYQMFDDGTGAQLDEEANIYRPAAEDAPGDGNFARRQALRYIVAYGVPTVFVCSYVSYFLQGLMIESIRRSSVPQLLGYILFDIVLRLVVFGLVSAGIFYLFARYAGSFGGSTDAAINAVFETMKGGVRFGNLSSVYLFAATLSAFPIFILLFLRLLISSAHLQRLWVLCSRWLPISEKPLRFSVFLMAGSLGFCAFSSALFLDAFRYYVG